MIPAGAIITSPMEAIVVGLIVLLIVWRVVKEVRLRQGRPCPRCGVKVYVGEMECPNCDFDFNTIGRS